MRLLCFNIQYGYGQDGTYDLSCAAAVIARSDIAALQEVDRHWSRTNHDDQPAILQTLLPDHYIAYGPVFDMDASTPGNRSRRRQFGPMIASRWPILWTRLHLLPLRPMIDPINTQTGALEACVDAPGGPLRVLSIHLAHVGREERLTQIAHLKSLVPTAPWSGTDDEPHRNWTESQPAPPCPPSALWMGDFNMEPGSAEYLALTGQTPYHPGSRYADGLIDAVAPANLYTHSKIIAGTPRNRQIDHIFATPDLGPRLHSAVADTACTASDHFPLWITLDP